MNRLALAISRIPGRSIYGSHLLILAVHILLIALDTWRCYKLGQALGMATSAIFLCPLIRCSSLPFTYQNTIIHYHSTV
jgi:hypothetical protein